MEKNLTDNYEKQIYIGRDLFLKYDQDMLIKKYKLKNDHAYLYLNYIGTEISGQPLRWFHRIYSRRHLENLQRIFNCYDDLRPALLLRR